VKIKMRRILKK